ncbi:MAG: hypothetical protein JWN44_6899 [Myxococcales bacterium]|nr:hypothetical protein [Myxococcales bacterium]
MSDWLAALHAQPSAPPGFLEFAASQPSLAAIWQNALRADWVIWMAARGFAGKNSARDIVDAVVIFADFAAPPAWKRALRFSATAEDALRRLDATSGDFDLAQIVSHVYLGLFVGAIVGTAAYIETVGRSVLFRELLIVLAMIVVTPIIAVIAQQIWLASVKRAAVPLTFENAVSLAEKVATDLSERSTVMKQMESARFMRKRLAGPVASGSST